jgi:hypothetical protein
MSIGGKREGAGRPRAPELLKKTPRSIKLPEWLWRALDDLAAERNSNRALLIEDALTRRHKLRAPDEV